MDQIEKALRKLTSKERTALESILGRIRRGQFEGLDLKKLVNTDNVYRVRKGDLRIIFTRRDDSIRIMSLERRSTTTYRKR